MSLIKRDYLKLLLIDFFSRVLFNLQEKLNEYEKIHVVLGNETCDLDSAVCSIIQAFWIYHQRQKENIDFPPVLPILNVPKSKFNIKTEVTYFFKLNGIPLESLIFR